MTVYDFLELCTDLSGLRVTIFDFTTEDVVFDSAKIDQDSTITSEIIFADLDCYEVLSFDIFRNNDGELHLEINIEVGDDDGI